MDERSYEDTPDDVKRAAKAWADALVQRQLKTGVRIEGDLAQFFELAIMADRGRRVTHTPGPWRQSFHASDEYEPLNETESYTIVRAGTLSHPIALMWDGDAGKYGVISPEEAKANATLMAAAPELLEALRQYVQEAEDEGHTLGSAIRRLEFARAAIAKAEGATDDELEALK